MGNDQSHPSSRLPHYERPSVIEVVLGVQFDELSGFQSAHLGSFWESVKSEYPRTEDKPPLANIFEDKPSGELGFDFLDLPPLRRVFLIHSDNNYLIQVQATRFLHNWRKLQPTDAYPRFVEAEARFRRGWSAFQQFIGKYGLGPIRANQYELSYINHIPIRDADMPKMIKNHTHLFSWPDARPDLFLPAPVSIGMDLKFRLPEKLGFLHVAVKHGRLLQGKTEVLILELTARGPAQSDTSDMAGWFSTAHEWIVRGFTDITTPSAHEMWGRVE